MSVNGTLKSDVFRVLVIDDEKESHSYIIKHLKRHDVVVEWATTNEEGLAKYREQQGKFDVIGFDGQVKGSKMETLELVRRISSEFSGPMVAISTSPDLRLEMITAGCNYQCEKIEFAKMVLDFLRINTPC